MNFKPKREWIEIEETKHILPLSQIDTKVLNKSQHYCASLNLKRSLLRNFETVTKTQFLFQSYNFIAMLGGEVPNRPLCPKADTEVNGIITILGILSV